MATYCVSYSIATAMISQDDSGLSEHEIETINKWLKFHDAENVQWESTEPYSEHYSNEGFYAYCEISEQFCLCDEITNETVTD